MPCMHAITCKNDRPEDYCHGWLTLASICETYAHHLNPLHDKEYWQKSDQLAPNPPPMKKGSRETKETKEEG
ncbi:hypothetical protein SESBI_01031 [Sesbania bispinosa]|nr:hypothetical protein SESBI_01031 [Sesbania bispinosa]